MGGITITPNENINNQEHDDSHSFKPNTTFEYIIFGKTIKSYLN